CGSNSCQMANSFCWILESRNACDAPWQTLLLQLATPRCLCDSIALTAELAARAIAGANANRMTINKRPPRFMVFSPSLSIGLTFKHFPTPIMPHIAATYHLFLIAAYSTRLAIGQLEALVPRQASHAPA